MSDSMKVEVTPVEWPNKAEFLRNLIKSEHVGYGNPMDRVAAAMQSRMIQSRDKNIPCSVRAAWQDGDQC